MMRGSHFSGRVNGHYMHRSIERDSTKGNGNLHSWTNGKCAKQSAFLHLARLS